MRRKGVVAYGFALGTRDFGAVPLFDAGDARQQFSRRWSEPLPQPVALAEMEACLREIGNTKTNSSKVAYLVLLPDLAQDRLIDVPVPARMKVSQFVEVNARSLFPHYPSAPLCTAVRQKRRSSQIHGACADHDQLAAICSTFEASGWTIESVSTAYSTVAALVSGMVGGSSVAMFAHEGVLHAIGVNGGDICEIRRLPLADGAAGIPYLLAELDDPLNRPVLFGSEVICSLPDRGTTHDRNPDEPARIGGSEPVALLLAPAGRDTRLQLPPIAVAEKWRADTQRKLRRMLAATAALAVISAALDGAYVRRELAHVGAVRTNLLSRVQEARDVHAASQILRRRLAALAHLEPNGTRYTSFVFELAEFLPHEAHLTSLQLTDDSLVIEGSATSAAATAARLRQSSLFRNIKLAGPIRRNTAEPAHNEHFKLVAE